MSEGTPFSGPILVLGATGYVGGRLVPRLLEKGCTVRAASRSLSKLKCRPYADHPRMQLVEVDVLDQSSLERALDGCRAAFYLVHSMAPGQKGFAEKDRRAATNMANAAGNASIDRVVYLGGLGQSDRGLSEHLESRMEVGRILQKGKVPLTWFRAAIILGAGSGSFEILRHLVNRLPVMITPKWVRTESQPIAISNVLHYLTACLTIPETSGRVFDICGPDVFTYQDLFQMYARIAGLGSRVIIPVPFLSPRLSAYWIGLVTPVPSALARPLTEGLKNRVVCETNEAIKTMPQDLLTCEQAIQRALNTLAQERVETCWSDAGVVCRPEWLTPDDSSYAGVTVLEFRYRAVYNAGPDIIWSTIARIGGRQGWYFADFLWTLRGGLDKILGGVGKSRGRRHPTVLRSGDALDVWRVLDSVPEKRLLLGAEMKMPGEAVLEFLLSSGGGTETELVLSAKFHPRGLLGLAYWYGMYPFHLLLFRRMLRRIGSVSGGRMLLGPEPARPEPFSCPKS